MADEPRVISAATTVVSKFLAPPFAVAMGAWLAVHWLQTMPMGPAKTVALLVLMFIALFWIAWGAAKLKVVALGDDALYVSNYRQEITVRLRDVVRVGQTQAGMNAVTIYLENDTLFGRRISFMPRLTFQTRFAWQWQPHPIVEELRDAVTAAKRRDLEAYMATEAK